MSVEQLRTATLVNTYWCDRLSSICYSSTHHRCQLANGVAFVSTCLSEEKLSPHTPKRLVNQVMRCRTVRNHYLQKYQRFTCNLSSAAILHCYAVESICMHVKTLHDMFLIRKYQDSNERMNMKIVQVAAAYSVDHGNRIEARIYSFKAYSSIVLQHSGKRHQLYS